MRDRALLVGWAVAVLAASFLHDLRLLGAAAGLVVIAVAAVAGRQMPRAARRALLAVAVFGGPVGATWLAWALFQGDPPVMVALGAFARFELRAFVLTFLTFGLLGQLSPERLLAGQPDLLRALTIVQVQIRLFRRLLEEYRFAFECRTTGPAGWSVRLRHAAAASGALIGRAVRESEDIGLAMEARGIPAPAGPSPPPTRPGRGSR